MSELVNYDNEFDSIIAIIEKSKMRAIRAVNKEMIEMYWQIGKYLSEKSENDGWGKNTVQDFADYLKRMYPAASGFSAQNLWRMKQFYETYRGNEKLSPLVREISWSNNLLIMSGCKTDEAKEFYIRLCIQNGYAKRDLERQIDSMLYERTMLSQAKNKDLIERHPAVSALRDSYVLEFLDVPEDFKEKDLRKAIIANLKKFILEFGRDFTLVGEEYRVQVGNTDFFIDLLFFNRALSCLVAVELKIGKFKPEHLGQLNFYLEALNRDVKKPDEKPSVGLILCSYKDDAVVEYALSSSLSPAMIADYTMKLPNKKLLEAKLREIAIMAENNEDPE
ncbi:MAG: DUF1016 family protein [Clostridia bacterium]|nr:DUF1016 family protein [Clostridia bacterium]